MQSRSSDPSGPHQGDDNLQPPQPPPIPSNKKSIWDKAKETLSEVSTHATKVAALGTAGATKTAEISKQTLHAAGEVTREAIGAGVQAYSGSKLESAVTYVDGELDQRGAKKAIKDTTGAVVDKLDQVTGKRLIELLETKLRAQDTYNDVLATRLAEALERIAKLEARFDEN
jgi:hypothetical protein